MSGLQPADFCGCVLPADVNGLLSFLFAGGAAVAAGSGERVNSRYKAGCKDNNAREHGPSLSKGGHLMEPFATIQFTSIEWHPLFTLNSFEFRLTLSFDVLHFKKETGISLIDFSSQSPLGRQENLLGPKQLVTDTWGLYGTLQCARHEDFANTISQGVGCRPAIDCRRLLIPARHLLA